MSFVHLFFSGIVLLNICIICFVLRNSTTPTKITSYTRHKYHKEKEMEKLNENNGSTYFYFSYGSNMLKERIQLNDPKAIPYAAAKLEGYKLEFNYRSKRWQGAVATLVEAPNSHLWGVVWIKESHTIASLDEQEGVHQNIYKPIFVQVTTIHGETLNCRCYQQTREWELDRRPSTVYKNVMIKGAREQGVPEDYILNQLEKVEDNGYNGEVEVSLDLLHKKNITCV